MNNVKYNILNKYYRLSEIITFKSILLPLDTKLKLYIFYSTQITNQEHSDMAKNHNGAYNACTNILIHIADTRRL